MEFAAAGFDTDENAEVLVEILNFAVINPNGLQSKYVLYSMCIKRRCESNVLPTFHRRYTDFWKLHQSLRSTQPEIMKTLVFPPKLYSGNFKQENIGKRSHAFEQYLTHLCDIKTAFNEPTFQRFFFAPEMKRGLRAFRKNQLFEAISPLTLVQANFSTLGVTDNLLLLVVHCCLSVSYAAIDDIEHAYDNSLRALNYVESNFDFILLPILVKSIRLAVILGKPREDLEAKVYQINSDPNSILNANLPTLAESCLALMELLPKQLL